MTKRLIIAGILFSMAACLRAANGQSPSLELQISIAKAKAAHVSINPPTAGAAPRKLPVTKTAPAALRASPKAVRWPEYPNRSQSGSHWRHNGGQISAEHLAGSHHSHEHFNYQWLKTQSNSQLTALGSDAHEGRVREAYVVRDRSTSTRSSSSSSCPNGQCPSSNTYQRRGLFRWR